MKQKQFSTAVHFLLSVNPFYSFHKVRTFQPMSLVHFCFTLKQSTSMISQLLSNNKYVVTNFIILVSQSESRCKFLVFAQNKKASHDSNICTNKFAE